jgi:hypothetical protein
MSFEQAYGMRSDELDARSDIYSLGVVAYEMLSGHVPFHSDTPLGYARKHITEEPPLFRTIDPGLGVPPAVESAVRKALVKDRDQRYASALAFAHALAGATEPASPAVIATTLPATQVAPPSLPKVEPLPSPKATPPPPPKIRLPPRVETAPNEIAAPPPRRVEEPPPPIKLPSVMEVPLPPAALDGGGYTSPGANEIRDVPENSSGFVAFFRDPERTWTIDLVLLIWLLLSIVLTVVLVTGNSPPFTVFAAMHVLVVGAALLATAQFARNWSGDSSKPRPWVWALVGLLAILAGNSVVLIIRQFEFMLRFLGHPYISFHSWRTMTFGRGPALWIHLIDVTALVVAGLRVRCRRNQWLMGSGLALAALIFTIVFGLRF